MIRTMLVCVLLGSAMMGCESSDDAVSKTAAENVNGEAAVILSAGADKNPGSLADSIKANPFKDAYFGDLHVHTGNSFDAFVFGVRRTPEDAYRFAMGEAIAHDGGGEVQIQGRALDFYAVTDHGEYLGVVKAMADPSHPLSQTETARQAFGGDSAVSGQTFRKIGFSFVTQQPLEDIYDKDFMAAVWRETAATADQFYKPGQFTTFAAYEFTAMTVVDAELGGAANLHRNVIFADAAPASIFTTLDSGDPAELWRWMEGQREQGVDSLAIPHNSNASNGLMFSLLDRQGNPVSSAELALRKNNEPLVEISQVKGTSDTRPIFSPDDDWAEFEHYPYLIGSTGMLSQDLEGSYVRPTLGVGLMADANHGVNPFEFGLIGSSDTHIGAGSYTEDAHSGKFPADGSDPIKRGSVPPEGSDQAWTSEGEISADDPLSGVSASRYSASGLAGVWAESNTREAIFEALKRRETFGTSGPRMRVRFFAGDYDDNVLISSALLAAAYQQGVPMGGKLDAQSEAPTMLVWALQDPLSAPLQRAQVIKVWRNELGEHIEQIYDVACSGGARPDAISHRCPDTGAGVDMKTCNLIDGTGSAELKALWRDPNFNAEQSAVYYVRVLENPSCRWSTWDAIRAGTPPNPRLPTLLQERAWSSPIWVN